MTRGTIVRLVVALVMVCGATLAADGGLKAPEVRAQTQPAINIAPTGGLAGSEVSVGGIGFAPQSALTALDIGGVSVLPSGFWTDAVGSFSIVFTVPGLATGPQLVAATVFGETAVTFFTVSEAAASVATALASISNELVRVWSYTADGWKMYDPADPLGSDLASLSDGRGYWVKVTAPCTVIYLGKTRILHIAGWNLMGW